MSFRTHQMNTFDRPLIPFQKSHPVHAVPLSPVAKSTTKPDDDDDDDDDDNISDLSLETTRIHASSTTIPSTNDHGIPNIITITRSSTLLAQQQEMHTTSLPDRPFRRQPRGSVNSFAIGNFVGQSIPLVYNEKDGDSPSSAVTTATMTTTTSFAQTRSALRKLDETVADKSRRPRRFNPLANEVLYLLGKTRKPIKSLLFRRTKSMHQLQASERGCLV